MRAHMTLLQKDSGKPLYKKFDWNDVLNLEDGESVRVAEISIYDHMPVIDGVPYVIAHMFSSRDGVLSSNESNCFPWN